MTKMSKNDENVEKCRKCRKRSKNVPSQSIRPFGGAISPKMGPQINALEKLLGKDLFSITHATFRREKWLLYPPIRMIPQIGLCPINNTTTHAWYFTLLYSIINHHPWWKFLEKLTLNENRGCWV